jgi:hypothetical protein
VLDVDQQLVAQFLTEADASLFACAREDVLRLAEEARRLRADLMRVRELLTEGRDDEAWIAARRAIGESSCGRVPAVLRVVSSP